MHKAPVMKGSGLEPIENKSTTQVFGQNLEDRVIKDETPPCEAEVSKKEKECFKKRKYEAITGEEHEETIFQGDFKLFVWDLDTSNWIEKGRGQLKMNESNASDSKKARLIMRSNGTLRIVLNVALDPRVFKVIAHTKTNIRFTDSQCVWAASGSDALGLKNLIEERLAQIRSSCKDQSSIEDEGESKRLKVEQSRNEPSKDDDGGEKSYDDDDGEESHDEEGEEESNAKNDKNESKDEDDGGETKVEDGEEHRKDENDEEERRGDDVGKDRKGEDAGEHREDQDAGEHRKDQDAGEGRKVEDSRDDRNDGDGEKSRNDEKHAETK